MYRIKIRKTIEFDVTVIASSMDEACRLASNRPFDYRDVTDTQILAVETLPDHPDRNRRGLDD